MLINFKASVIMIEFQSLGEDYIFFMRHVKSNRIVTRAMYQARFSYIFYMRHISPVKHFER